jgi:hypothetical protein
MYLAIRMAAVPILFKDLDRWLLPVEYVAVKSYTVAIVLRMEAAVWHTGCQLGGVPEASQPVSFSGHSVLWPK